MSYLSKRERVEAALRGEAVDRVPVSAWRHFIEAERAADTLALASLKHLHEFDWDWLKVNPRATYYAEAWGNQYDYAHYDSVLPRFVQGPINTPADLDKVRRVSPTEAVFAEQLDLVRQVRLWIGDTHFVQTVFSPLSVLAFLIARPTRPGIDEAVQAQYSGLRQFIDENPQGVHAALQNIAGTLAVYAAAAVDSGASGLFFAIVKLARQGILTEREYAEFGTPYDLQVLNAVQGAPFNLLHICGPQVYFEAVTEYPVHAINWAAVKQQNPNIAQARQLTNKALMGGVDEFGALESGTPDEVVAEARAAIQAAGGRGFLLTPGCGTPLDVRDENLHALRRATELAPTPL